MESDLKQTFTDDEINNFYVDFATDMKKYEAVNSHTMDQLYGFIDFPQFKENIIGYKKGPMAIKAEEQKAQDDAYRKTLNSMTENSQAKFYDLKNEDVNDPALKWTKTVTMAEKDGIEVSVYKRPMEGSTLDLTRADCVMRGVTLANLKTFFGKYDTYAFRMDKRNNLKHFKWVVNNEPEGNWVMYSRSKIGAMTSDRDNLVQMTINDVDGGKALFQVLQPTELADYPPHDDYVRMVYFKSALYTQEGPDVRVVQFENFDLRGYFPAKLLNMIASQHAKDALMSIYEIVQEIAKE